MPQDKSFRHSGRLDLRTVADAYDKGGLFERHGYENGSNPYMHINAARMCSVSFEPAVLYGLNLEKVDTPVEKMDFSFIELGWRTIEPDHERQAQVISDTDGTEVSIRLKRKGTEVGKRYVESLIIKTLGIGSLDHWKQREYIEKNEAMLVRDRFKFLREADRNFVRDIGSALGLSDGYEVPIKWEGNWSIPRFTAKMSRRIQTPLEARRVCRFLEEQKAQVEVSLNVMDFTPDQLRHLVEAGVPPNSVGFLVSGHRKKSGTSSEERLVYFHSTYYDKETGKLEVKREGPELVDLPEEEIYRTLTTVQEGEALGAEA